jgi:tetratricopeptide (TPR) repeat protein
MNRTRFVITLLVAGLVAAPLGLFAQTTDTTTTTTVPVTTTTTATPATTTTTVAPAATSTPATETPASSTAPVVLPAAAPAPELAPFFKDAPAAIQGAYKNAEDFIVQGKWLSAWQAMAAIDPDNQNGYALAEKIRIAIDGYAQTNMHMAFGFVDLKPGEDIASVRTGGTAKANSVNFDPKTLAKAIEDKGGEMPAVLSLELGNYYYTVWKEYQGQWVEDDNAILADGTTAYERAFAYETWTVNSLDKQSEMLVTLQKFDGAVNVLNKAIELSPNNPALMIRLADAYAGLGKMDENYKEVDKVLAATSDPQTRYDAYVSAVKAGLSAKDKISLEKYVSGLEKDFPTEYLPGLIRHLVAVKLGDSAAADAAADAVTAAFPGNPEVIRSILSTWLNEQNSDSGFKYLDRQIAKSGQEDTTMAALYFYRSLLDAEVSATKESYTTALADLGKAEAFFQSAKSPDGKPAYAPDNAVYSTIDNLKKQWTDALNALSTPAATTTTTAPAPTTPAATSETTTSTTVAPAASTPTTTTAPATPSSTTTTVAPATDATSSATTSN